MRYLLAVLIAAAFVISSGTSVSTIADDELILSKDTTIGAAVAPTFHDDKRMLQTKAVNGLEEERGWPLLETGIGKIKMGGKKFKHATKRMFGMVSPAGEAKFEAYKGLHKLKRGLIRMYRRVKWWFQKNILRQKHALEEGATRAKHKVSEANQKLKHRTKESEKTAYHRLKEAFQKFRHRMKDFFKKMRVYAY
uniref:Secreted RxLR effector protein 126 n=1 Tax=Plasmopara viticola TaxID=143451 RepID=RL126_PLAVT|nr:RecName: Full=Secreted RxLR effector protein 126; Flags: Precursor [Plasmopara viticola]